MKTLNDLSNMFDKWVNNADKNVIEAEEITAEQVYEDVIDNAPKGTTSNYVNSIQKEETIISNGLISTFIGSDLTVGPTIWGEVDNSKNAPAGTFYNLGYLLENGTFEHAIPNAFGKGLYHGFTDDMGRFHKGTLDVNWHPGSIAQPHYSLALEKNKKFFKDNIKMVWRDK